MSAEHDGPSGEHGGVSGGHGGGARARRVVIAALAVVLALATASAVFFGVRAQQLRGADSAANAALVDVAATDAVIEQVSASLKAVFSYDYTQLDRTENAVDLALTGEAAAEYRREFDAATQRAKERKLVKASTVLSIGVRELTEHRATVLVFLDQQVRGSGAAPTSSTATLDVTAIRDAGGAWRISDINPL